ncbi:MAG: glycogen/starch synthase [Chloroflexi bacterium]|nr:glycogen/starch synthase [Chloroflexota bacterium]
MTSPVKILFLASEADPYVKVGGLGDVGGSLPSALLDLNTNLDVRLVIPFHSAIRMENFDIRRELVFTIPRAGGEVPVQVFSTELRGLPVYFISGEPFSHATKVYDTDAKVDGEKFIFFSMAALELAKKLDWRPDIVHANDWHTASALYGVRLMQTDPFWAGVKTIFTVHNLCYMGAGSDAALSAYGLPAIDAPELPWWGQQTPLPLGLWSADEIVAVSPSYAEEIQSPEYGCGLESFLQSRHEHVTGIVNGIDTLSWDPRSDDVLINSFSSDQLGARAENKKFLQTQFGLQVNATMPLLAMVTRMDQQKGVDIAIAALRIISKLGWQAILLGSGNPEIESMARRLESDFPNRVCAVIRYDGKLSRQIYGGADMLLMPSRYEPCGLAQMIAMRYGAVPVARATGGLRDTIAEGYSGFLFTDASPSVMAGALRRAIATFKKPGVWEKIQRAGMRGDYSWQVSARQYADLYFLLLTR